MHSSSKVFLETTNTKPEIAVILGSGLTNFFEPQNIIKEIPYTDLPDFPQPTVKGHAGKLVLGEISSIKLVCMYVWTDGWTDRCMYAFSYLSLEARIV